METTQKLSRREKLSLIGKYLRPCWGHFAAALLCACLAMVFNALTPQIIRITVDSILGTEPVRLPAFLMRWLSWPVLEARPLTALWWAAGGVLLTALLRGVCSYGQRLQLARGSESYVKGIRDDLYRHIQYLPFAWHKNNPTGDIIQRCTSDVDVIRQFVCNQLVEVVRTVFLIALYLCIMFSMNLRLSLISALFIPIVGLSSGVFYRKISGRFQAADEAEGDLTTCAQENLTAVRVVRAFGRERYEDEKFNAKNQRFSQLWIRLGKLLSVYWASGTLLTCLQVMVIVVTGACECVAGRMTLGTEEQTVRTFRALTQEMHDAGIGAARLNAIYIPLVLFASTMAVAIVLLRGGYMVSGGLLELATLSTFTTYAVGIFEPIQMTAANIAEFISLQASIERVTDLMDKVPQIQDSPEVVEKYGDAFHPKRENWEPIRGEIEFRDVTFRYPDGGDNVLEHFSLHIPQGATVAIVGETGAGKSTLVNLACRFFEPTEGQILIDGVDYRQRSQLWLHSNIGYVLQDPHLFSGTVRENIRYGKLDASDAEVEAAARAVSADTVVEKLDKGWDSDVGEGGGRLSTGQKQLISFARAVLADPRIFVLDEATSSIDTQTEQLIQQAIDHLLRDRTSFLIAHRLSTIRKADMILVVRDGRIVEQGTHQELLRRRGYYHDLYSKQFAEESAARILQ